MTNLDTSLGWYQRVFGARHLERYDHFDGAGIRYALIVEIPGVDASVELRWAPYAVVSMRGYDPVTFSACSDDNLDDWVEHLDAQRVEHSPIITALAGKLIVLLDPDGTFLRIMTLPRGGVDAIQMSERADEPAGPWLMPHLMRRS